MSNLAARESLERAKQLFLEKPAAARKPNAAATAVWRDGLSFEVSGPAAERVITDMPEPMGGAGAGPNPGWLLRAGMASCTATAIAMRAAMQGIALKTLEVKVESASGVRGWLALPMFRPRSATCACSSGSARRGSMPRTCATWWHGAKRTRQSAARCGTTHPSSSTLPWSEAVSAS